MGKTAAASTLSPDSFSLGQPVYSEDYIEAIESLNYAAAQAVQSFDHSAVVRNWTLTDSNTFLDFYIWIPPWAKQVDLFLTTSGTGTATPSFTVGSASAWTPGVGVKTTTLNTSATGTGWQSVTFTGGVTSGSIVLESLHIQTKVVGATDLPDPVVE